jgi:hypothetical protein
MAEINLVKVKFREYSKKTNKIELRTCVICQNEFIRWKINSGRHPSFISARPSRALTCSRKCSCQNSDDRIKRNARLQR